MNLESELAINRELTDGTTFPEFHIEDFNTLDYEPLPDHLFRLKWENVRPGNYDLIAIAKDNQGETTESEPVSIKVAPPPLRARSIASPAIRRISSTSLPSTSWPGKP